MLRRRRLLQASAGLIAAPALVERVGAQSAFDWKQAKGAKVEVVFQKGPNADVLQARHKEFEELTGIRVGSEQIPEQQQRQKWRWSCPPAGRASTWRGWRCTFRSG